MKSAVMTAACLILQAGLSFAASAEGTVTEIRSWDDALTLLEEKSGRPRLVNLELTADAVYTGFESVSDLNVGDTVRAEGYSLISEPLGFQEGIAVMSLTEVSRLESRPPPEAAYSGETR